MEAVNELDEPYTIKPCVSGKRGYSPKVVVVIVSLCEYWNAGYRRVHSSVKGSRDLREKLGLVTVPFRTTIGNAYQKIPESYFHKLTEIITWHINTGNVAGDATGMSDSRKKVWLDVRTGGKKLKKNWIKLHTLIDIQTRTALLIGVTPGVTGDCPAVVEMIKKLPKFLKQASGCFDSTYLSGEFCNLLMSLNLTPFIKPKSNTKRNAESRWS